MKKSITQKEVKSFFVEKLLLIVALGLEVVALLMRRGVLSGDAELVTRLTVAGVILLLIWLVKDGLTRKYRYYSKKWKMGPYAEDKEAMDREGDK